MKPEDKPDNRGPEKVTITINNTLYEVRSGVHPVAQIKTIPNPNIPPSDVLCQLVGTELKPLDHNARIDIKGGEIFASHCPSGGAS